MSGSNFCLNSDFHVNLGNFYVPQIYDMGPTALFPLRRKACWGFFRPKNLTWVLKASTLPIDLRSRIYLFTLSRSAVCHWTDWNRLPVKQYPISYVFTMRAIWILCFVLNFMKNHIILTAYIIRSYTTAWLSQFLRCVRPIVWEAPKRLAANTFSVYW